MLKRVAIPLIGNDGVEDVRRTSLRGLIIARLVSVISMMYLERFLYIRIAVIWNNRNLPSYYGPSLAQLGLLFTLAVVNTIVLLALLILFLRNIWTLGANETTIEGWEIERHKTLCRRARALGGYLEGPNGIKVYIKRQEFPYDIGIWNNIRDGMGGSNN
ncbi:palmitoyltransferase pfa4, partial [Trichophyton interdigitale H6]